MVADADELPLVGRTKRMLGVVIPDEIAPDHGGRVHPETGGMSVFAGLDVERAESPSAAIDGWRLERAPYESDLRDR
jgi:hypothetical protein